MAPKKTPATEATPAKPTRVRASTPFDEAKRAQAKLEALEMKRQQILEELGDEARAMLEALEELRAKQQPQTTESDLPEGE
jgi:hypothetical protein